MTSMTAGHEEQPVISSSAINGNDYVSNTPFFEYIHAFDHETSALPGTL